MKRLAIEAILLSLEQELAVTQTNRTEIPNAFARDGEEESDLLLQAAPTYGSVIRTVENGLHR